VWGPKPGRERVSEKSTRKRKVEKRTAMFCSATSTVLAAEVNWDWTGVRSMVRLESYGVEGRGGVRGVASEGLSSSSEATSSKPSLLAKGTLDDHQASFLFRSSFIMSDNENEQANVKPEGGSKGEPINVKVMFSSRIVHSRPSLSPLSFDC
jgi:hypothetical protein